MSARCLLVGLCLTGLAAHVKAQGGTQTLGPRQLPGFTIHHWGHYPDTPSTTPGNVVHNLFVSFDNLSRKEVASVDLRLTVYRGGRVIYKREPIHVDRFNDFVIHNPKGAPPGLRNFSNAPNPITVELPVDQWGDDRFVVFEITSLQVYEGEQDLHDLGHLWTWLHNVPEKEAIARIESDPALARSVSEGKYTALSVAYASASAGVVKAMAQATGFGTEALPYRLTPMHLAAVNPHREVLELARQQGGDPNAKAAGDQTPLMFAFFHRRLANARWLLRHGANPNARATNGATAFGYALDANTSVAVKLLVQAGMDPKSHDANGRGWMHEASSHSPTNLDTLDLLYRTGLSPNDFDPRFRITPLMAALHARRNDAVRWLLQHGARLDLRDAQGRDAFDYAREADEADHGTVYLDSLLRWSVRKPMRERISSTSRMVDGRSSPGA